MMNCDNNPWDPRCNTVPKPEMYTVFYPSMFEDNNNVRTFMTYDEAKDWIDDNSDGVGVIHKHNTQVVYFNKEENTNGE